MYVSLIKFYTDPIYSSKTINPKDLAANLYIETFDLHLSTLSIDFYINNISRKSKAPSWLWSQCFSVAEMDNVGNDTL